ncbi:MAG: PEP-CTERM sorting domain-containing protein [Phycisphaerales bacterium]|nr:PEP-CTERM sorting domain-containing protein [Phycisphaerales bacterium]
MQKILEIKMKKFIAILIVSSCATIANAEITDYLIYEQLSPTLQGDGASVYYSNPVHDQIMYDQFRFDADTSILGFGFWGALNNDTEITVSIYEQDAATGLLGSRVHEERFSTNDLNAEVSGQAWDGFWITDEYRSIAEFSDGFTAQEGQTYWLSITGDSLFSWTFGANSGGNNTLYSNTAQDEYWDPTDIGLDATNLAFSIYGTPVPAPSTLIALAGLFGIGATRRRRGC